MRQVLITLLITILALPTTKAQTTNLKVTESKEYKDKVKSTDVLSYPNFY
ncbi:MAG: hypothetical protein JXK08_00230 [Flavobacteriaceae bacterium]|nr:hypothetical protein [Flavobacteriaceae bacterium]